MHRDRIADAEPAARVTALNASAVALPNTRPRLETATHSGTARNHDGAPEATTTTIVTVAARQSASPVPARTRMERVAASLADTALIAASPSALTANAIPY